MPIKLDSKEGVEAAIRKICDAQKPKKPENICNLGRCFNGGLSANGGYAFNFINELDLYQAMKCEQQCRKCCQRLGEEMREIQEKIHSVREFEVSVVNESDLLKRLRLEEHKISLLKRRAEENHIVVLGRKRRIQEKNRKEIAHGI